jgi:hypothetical protein
MFTHLHVPVRNTVTMTELIIFLEENKKKLGGLELEFNNTASHLSNQTLPHSNVVMYIRDLSWYVLLERQKLMASGGPWPWLGCSRPLPRYIHSWKTKYQRDRSPGSRHIGGHSLSSACSRASPVPPLHLQLPVPSVRHGGVTPKSRDFELNAR